jgi:pimeloyl-ACP methyl ester carboxylesterase
MEPFGLFALIPMLTCFTAHGQDGEDKEPHVDAKAIIEDLGRIVAPSGVQESYKTEIGGIDQWINVRGQDRSNPVILFIHGGPASPVTPAMWQFQRPVEEYFTVVNWDQRGAGKSYRETDPESIADTIQIARYVDDAIEVAEHIRKRYGRDKLILMGHSWGTVVGMNAALKRPGLFCAYVGIGQVINTRENERLSFEYALEQATQHQNTVALQELESISPYPGDEPITRERIGIARKWAQHYGGLSAYRETSRYFFRAPLLSPEYSAEDVSAIDEGNVFTLGRVLSEFLEVDFTAVRSFPIPVLMFMGRHDYTTPSTPTARWLRNVAASYKRGIWFERSAHMVPWEEPGKFLVSLLRYVRPLASSADSGSSIPEAGSER